MIHAGCTRHFILAIAALIASGGCGGSAPGALREDAPNILLYVVDTLRADSLGCYGHPVVETPNVDAFAREGTLFTSAFVASSWTRPSIASILTSTYPGIHGAEGRYDRLAEALLLLPEMLRGHGYRTGLITANPNVGSFFGFQQGFDDFIELYKRRDAGYVKPTELATTGDVVAQRAVEWIAAAEGPFCLVVLSIDPHTPYTPPAEFDRYGGSYRGPLVGIRKWINSKKLSSAEKERIRSLYYGEIAFNDHAFGSLIAGLRDADLYDRTIFVYTSDHGEEFWEHGARGHGKTLHDEVLRVPLIVRYPPDVEAGRRAAHPVEAVDIVPTVLELAGVPVPAGLNGRSLLSSEDREVFSTLRHHNRRYVALRRGSWKLLVNLESGDKQLFGLNDLEPERRDVASEQPDVVRQLWALVGERLAQNRARRDELHGSGPAGGVAPEDLPEEEREALRALGYVGSEEK